uniref:S1 motif domain-containing protein n=1 Tax=Alexandrium monilatum TaxID=311494 RepID=A0A7S4UR65_9DINO|mmetsp:Transcript_55483/g.172518  ORF Transcript_55483/g.172518 Transcript_55483/m.172518 type:complete len:745 (+) Transcript_55483:134-2368(+)
MIQLQVGDKVSGQVIKSVIKVGYVFDINAPCEALMPLEHLGKKQPKLRVGEQVQDMLVIDVDPVARGFNKIILSGKDMVKLGTTPPELGSPSYSSQSGRSPVSGTPPEFQNGVFQNTGAYPAAASSRPQMTSSPTGKIFGGGRTLSDSQRGGQGAAGLSPEEGQSYLEKAKRVLSREEIVSERQAAARSTANAKIARAREAEEQKSAEWRPARPEFLSATRRGTLSSQKPAEPSSPKQAPTDSIAGGDSLVQPRLSAGGRALVNGRRWVGAELEEEQYHQARPSTAPAMSSGTSSPQGRRSPPRSDQEVEEERSSVRRPHQARASPPGSPGLGGRSDLENGSTGRHHTDSDYDSHYGTARQRWPSSQRAVGPRLGAPPLRRRSTEGSPSSSAINSPQDDSSPGGGNDGTPNAAGQGAHCVIDSRIVRELRLVVVETAREVNFPTSLLSSVLRSLDGMQEVEEPGESKPSGGHRSGRASPMAEAGRRQHIRVDPQTASPASSRPASAAKSRGSQPNGLPLQSSSSRSSRSTPDLTVSAPKASAQTAAGAGAGARCSSPHSKAALAASAPAELTASALALPRQRIQQSQPVQGRASASVRGSRRSAGSDTQNAGAEAAAGTGHTAAKARPSTASRQREEQMQQVEHFESVVNPTGTPVKDLAVGDEANGRVVAVVPGIGVFFDVGAQRYGLVPKQMMGKEIPRDLRVGDVVEGLTIDEVDCKTQRFTLSALDMEFGPPIYMKQARH